MPAELIEPAPNSFVLISIVSGDDTARLEREFDTLDEAVAAAKEDPSLDLVPIEICQNNNVLYDRTSIQGVI
ncbi:MAG: hypothetical protein H0T73_14650 [Ardenticatenales bacterium]|nr:hypothetical protein [Ardenticatenales bacterium]